MPDSDSHASPTFQAIGSDKWMAAEDLEELARARLNPALFDFVSGGAGDELTMAANLAAFRAWRLRAFAINGRAGVERLLRFLAADLARTLVLLGAESTGQLGPRFLQREMGAR